MWSQVTVRSVALSHPCSGNSARSEFVNAHKYAYVLELCCFFFLLFFFFFSWQKFPRVWFLKAVMELDENLTFGKVCERDLFVTASNYSGTEGAGERGGMQKLMKKMAPAYLNVSSARWMPKLLFSPASITCVFLTMEKHFLPSFILCVFLTVFLFGSGGVIGRRLYALWSFASILTVTTNHLVVCFV